MAADLRAVDFAEGSPARPSIFVDTVSLQTLLAAVLLFSLLLLAPIIVTLLGPQSLQTSQESSNFTNRSAGLPFHVDLSLSALCPSFGFFDVTAVFSRAAASSIQALPLNLSRQIILSRRGNVSSFTAIATKEYTLFFKPGSSHSQKFPFFHQKITHFDRADLRLSIESEFSELDGCLFELLTLGGGVLRHARVLKAVVSAIVVYTCFLSGGWGYRRPDRVGQSLALLLSVSSVLASNPICLIVSDAAIDDALFTVFSWVFRFFLLYQIDTARASPRIAFAAAAFFAAAVAEALGLPRAAPALPIVCYSVVLVIVIAAAAFRAEPPLGRRVAVFGGCAIGDLVLDCAARADIWPQLSLREVARAAFAMTAAALALFVLRPAGREDYRAISLPEAEEPGLEVDALSEEPAAPAVFEV
jgi:hypothetical protein